MVANKEDKGLSHDSNLLDLNDDLDEKTKINDDASDWILRATSLLNALEEDYTNNGLPKN